MTIDLRKLAEEFHPKDIKWRVLRADMDQNDKPYAVVFAYISKRALQQRLDDVVGPGNWKTTELKVDFVGKDFEGKEMFSMQVGIGIKIDGEWVVKYDVSQCTDIEPIKGGFSTATKRAGSQWGIGRYLEHIGQNYVDLARTKRDGESVKLYMKANKTTYFWNPPKLPGWSMPKVKTDKALDSDKPVTDKVRSDLYFAWREKFASNEKDKVILRAAFDSWVFKIVGEFPIGDLSCWTQQIVDDCRKRIEITTDVNGPDASVPFE